MSTSPALATLASLVALTSAAVATDVRSHRIPNRLVLIGMAAGVALHAFALVADASPLAGAVWWAPLAGMAAGLAALMPLYLLHACGAGDVKLMAMAGAFIGPADVLPALLYTLLAGGALSLLVMFLRGVAVQTLVNVFSFLGHGLPRQPLRQTAARMPYAVAIAIGTLASQVAGPLGGAA